MMYIFLHKILACLITLPICFTVLFSLYLDLKNISFNPKRNYEKWDNLNWLGVWCGTIALIIAFYPVVISRGICELSRWMFTVGRKR